MSRVAWAGDTLLAFVNTPRYEALTCLAGFSLSTGRHLWTWEDVYDVDALASRRGHVVGLRHDEHGNEVSISWQCHAHVLDPTDGREVARRRLRATRDESFALHLHGSRMLWVSRASRPETPVKAFDWR
ncbi:hypothetical protein [Streptomyces sp. NPDC101150]|uniref:hypothetical protein n=1 Tax=Streptomyces sp. NPDC101150 TaxID=3366114 RepID=UPI0037FD92F8